MAKKFKKRAKYMKIWVKMYNMHKNLNVFLKRPGDCVQS